MKRARYQQGSLTIKRRKKLPDAWLFRWRETQPDGRRVARKVIVGTIEDYPTESMARRAVEGLRILANQINGSSGVTSMTVEALVRHYRETELSEENDDENLKSFSTKQCYRSILRTWVLPRWGEARLPEVKSPIVERWLRQIPKANGTKSKIRAVMHALFNHALRYEWSNKNPIKLVRQSAKREQTPEVLTIQDIQALLAELGALLRTLVLLDAGTGLRVSELLALKWKDVDFERLEVHVTRSIWHQIVGRCKTEASQKPMPLDGYTALDLWQWKLKTPYNRPEDWVFASPRMKGEQPY